MPGARAIVDGGPAPEFPAGPQFPYRTNFHQKLTYLLEGGIMTEEEFGILEIRIKVARMNLFQIACMLTTPIK